MKRWIACALCTVACISVGAQPQATDESARNARLEQIASSYTKDNAFMGTVLVAEGDKIVLDKGYGMASLEWSIPNTPDTKFRLGSLTKQFTATLILLLQQDGKLKIQDPVSQYLTDTPKTWSKITIAELLGHTSGIPNFTSLKEFGKWRMNPHTPDEMVDFFRDKPLDFEPGSQFSYSNSGFEVLGTIIEKVSGKTYGDMLRERIFEPLGMKDSGLDNDELILPKRAEGYLPSEHGLQVARSESMTVPWAAGSIYSTTHDLLTWEHALFGGKVLSADSLKLMTTAGKGDYGLGIGVQTKDGVRDITHNGGIEGFNTSLSWIPDHNIAVIVLSNVNGGGPDQMSSQLIDTMLGKSVTLANERTAVPITKDELSRFVGVYDLAPTFALTIAGAGDSLTVQGTNQPALPMMYQGVKDGHARFFITQVNAEIEFVPGANGAVESLILHQNGHDAPAKRH